MKNQTKSQLAFTTNAVIELNQEQLITINGGTSGTLPTILSCTFCVSSSDGQTGKTRDFFQMRQ